MKNLISECFDDYQLLDSASGRKLEIIAGLKLERPCPQAIWKNRLYPDQLKKLHSNCVRKKDGGGEWEHYQKMPDSYKLKWLAEDQTALQFKLKLTSFGHCGIFFEQSSLWNKIAGLSIKQAKLKKRPTFLNLFGYTGAASIVAAKYGAEVTHVDSAKGVLTWGRENADLNLLKENSIKWIHEDAFRFVQNAKRRKIKFDGILADPPSWGHGTKKEVWNFDKDIAPFVESLSEILEPTNSYIILSSHTHGVQAEALKNILEEHFPNKLYDYGDLGVKHANDDRVLPAGIYSMAQDIIKS